jgi:hypothetical protein
MPGSLTPPGCPGTHDVAPVHIAFRDLYCVGTEIFISWLNGWPMRSPADASPLASRPAMHGLGPMRVVTPSSQWTFTTYSLPASRRTEI